MLNLLKRMPREHPQLHVHYKNGLDSMSQIHSVKKTQKTTTTTTKQQQTPQECHD